MKTPFLVSEGSVSVLRIPLRQPFITAQGRQDYSTSIGISLRLRGGSEGYGEASSSIVLSHLRPERIIHELKKEIPWARNRDVRNLKDIVSQVWNRHRNEPPVAAAFECALTTALCGAYGIKPAQWWGRVTDQLTTDLTISAASAEQASAAARRAVQQGFKHLKVKVGTKPDDDWKRVSAVWEAAREYGPRAQLLLDGNQGMTPSSALRLVERCLKSNIRVGLLEQPLRKDQFLAMAQLKRRCPVPLAADESAWTPNDVLRLLDMDAAGVFNVKIAKTGIQESLEIIALVRSAGKRLMIGCMRETAKGLSPSVHLACGTGAFDFVDLDSDCLLVPDQPRGDFIRQGPEIKLL